MTCPVCGNNNARFISGSFFPKFHYCNICTAHFLNEVPAQVYEENYYQIENQNRFSKTTAKLIRVFFLRLRIYKVKLLLKTNKNAAILDYGSGPGHFVKAATAKNLGVVGYEPSEAAVKIAENNFLPVYNKIPMDRQYQLITFWGSLEHSDKPQEIIKNCREYLKNNGQVLIALQNADSWEAKWAKRKWFHYDYPFHRIQFTPKALKLMLENNSYKVVSFDFFFPEYTVSGLVQTFLNFFFPANAFYSIVSNRRINIGSDKASLISLISLITLLIFLPFLATFFLIALVFKKTGAMVIIAEKL